MRYKEAADALGDGLAPVVIVTLRAPSQVWRLASEPLRVPYTDGDGPYQYHAAIRTLDLLEDEIDVWGVGGASALSSASIEVEMTGENAATLEGADYALWAATADVALIWPGQDYAERQVIMEGAAVAGVMPGRLGERTEITFEQVAPPSGAPLCDPSRDVGTDYPAILGIAADLSGRVFPRMIGKVRNVPAQKTGTVVGSGSSLLLCDHEIAADVVIGDVSIFADNAAHSPAGTISLFEDTTADGKTCRHVKSTDLGDYANAGDSSSFTVSMTTGAHPSIYDRATAALYADEVIAVLLDLSGVSVDWQRQREHAALYSDWDIGVYSDEIADTLEIIRSRILPVMPLIERTTSKGVYLHFADPSRAPVEFALTLGQELIAQEGRPEWGDTDRCRNSFTVEYAYNHATSRYASSFTLDADKHALCAYSAQMLGTRQAEVVRCNITWNDRTAEQIAVWQARKLALPRRMVSYALEPSLYWLREGMIGTITDADTGLTTAKCAVRSVRRAGRPWRATFEFFDSHPSARF